MRHKIDIRNFVCCHLLASRVFTSVRSFLFDITSFEINKNQNIVWSSFEMRSSLDSVKELVIEWVRIKTNVQHFSKQKRDYKKLKIKTRPEKKLK